MLPQGKRSPPKPLLYAQWYVKGFSLVCVTTFVLISWVQWFCHAQNIKFVALHFPFKLLTFFLLPLPQCFWDLEAEHTIVNSLTSYESVHQQPPTEERTITYSKVDVFYFIVESFHFVRAYNIDFIKYLYDSY